MCVLMSVVYRGLRRLWPFFGIWVTSGRQDATVWTAIFVPMTFLVYSVLFAVFWLTHGAYITNLSRIRETIMKARVLPCLVTCSGWGRLLVTKTFLGIMARVNTSVCTFPPIRFKLLCGCVSAIGLWRCIGILRARAVSVCVGSAVPACLRMSIMWSLNVLLAATFALWSSSGLCFDQDFKSWWGTSWPV